ncbi:MAG: DUF5103 domain-containing protein, partial [Chloroflexia bacterium]|nr:DUF5103 domain-containing protein [Chloroflexia bacterium]
DRLLAVDKKPDINHVYLRPDENKAEKEYDYKPDINGKRTIKLENSDRSNIMADYCFVYFQLKAPIPLQAGDYYIYGALTDWGYQEAAKMEYDFKNEMFLLENCILNRDTTIISIVLNRLTNYLIMRNLHIKLRVIFSRQKMNISY